MSEEAKDGTPPYRDTLESLLKALSIKVVVLVDDRLQPPIGREQIISACRVVFALRPNELATILPEIDFGRGEIWEEDLGDLWDNADTAAQKEIVEKLVAHGAGDIFEDASHVEKFRAIFGSVSNGLQVLSPSEWKEKSSSLIKGLNIGERILSFFDFDLSEAPGYAADGERSGIGLVKEFAQLVPEEQGICALLSHKLAIDGEMDAWRSLSKQHGIEFGRFLPISKSRLDEPESFIGAVKKTSLNAYCEKMKLSLFQAVQRSASKARDLFDSIDPYDFDYMVLQSSLKEGAPEYDTLLRIYLTFERDVLKAEFLGNSVTSFFDATQQARAISASGDPRDDHKEHRWGIRRQELFEDGGLVNKFHMPISNGDIFQAGDQTFILVGQPCDLMVRANGLRGENDGNKTVALLEVKRKTPKEVNKDSKKNGIYYLPYFYGGSNDFGRVDLETPISVHLDALDLASFNDDGFVGLDLDKLTSAPPVYFHLAWQKRWNAICGKYEEFAERYRRISDAISEISADVAEMIRLNALPKICVGNSVPLIPSYSGSVLSFGLYRIGRLRSPTSEFLLTAFTRHLGRDGGAHDFSR